MGAEFSLLWYRMPAHVLGQRRMRMQYALVRSFILHFLPIALFHLDLHVRSPSGR